MVRAELSLYFMLPLTSIYYHTRPSGSWPTTATSSIINSIHCAPPVQPTAVLDTPQRVYTRHPDNNSSDEEWFQATSGNQRTSLDRAYRWVVLAVPSTWWHFLITKRDQCTDGSKRGFTFTHMLSGMTRERAISLALQSTSILGS